MKSRYLLTLFGALATGTTLFAAPAHAKDTGFSSQVYQAAPEVICDKKSGFCVDGTGISMSHTAHYLGNDAVKRFASMGPGIDTSSWGFINRVYCSVEEKKCYNDRIAKQFNRTYSEVLFGRHETRQKKAGTKPATRHYCEIKSGRKAISIIQTGQKQWDRQITLSGKSYRAMTAHSWQEEGLARPKDFDYAILPEKQRFAVYVYKNGEIEWADHRYRPCK